MRGVSRGHNEDVNEKVSRWVDELPEHSGNVPRAKKRRRLAQRPIPKTVATMPLAVGQTQLTCGGGGGATSVDDASRFFRNNPKQFVLDLSEVRQSGVTTITNIGAAFPNDQRWKVAVVETVLPLRIGYAAHIRYGDQPLIRFTIGSTAVVPTY